VRDRLRIVLLVAVAGLATAAATSFVGSRGPEHRDHWVPAVAAELAALPPSPRPAFVPGRPLELRPGTSAVWAPVRRVAWARTSPTADARPLIRLATQTPEGTTNLVVLFPGGARRNGRLWVRARLPLPPNGGSGWVPRDVLAGYHLVRTQLIIDRARLRATLLRDGRPIFRAPVGIGTERAPTPRGRFYIRNRLTGFTSPTYGPLAFGTSARSNVTDWPNGAFVGIHGTDRPELIPGRVSQGCIRLRNPDILRLGRLMPVGTPLIVS
jgi:lipoprotein-anchoring transpeptidase ErfK/SrfK